MSIFLWSAPSCTEGETRPGGGDKFKVVSQRKAPQLSVQVTHESRFPITVLITLLLTGQAIEYNARVGNLSRIAFMTGAGLAESLTITGHGAIISELR